MNGREDRQTGEITRLIGELRQGNRAAESGLMEAVYPELKRRAAAYLRGERRGHTLQATALVNEAYMRLLKGADVDWKGRSHFFAVAALAMRRILVDYARKHNGGGRPDGHLRVEFSDVL